MKKCSNVVKLRTRYAVIINYNIHQSVTQKYYFLTQERGSGRKNKISNR